MYIFYIYNDIIRRHFHIPLNGSINLYINVISYYICDMLVYIATITATITFIIIKLDKNRVVVAIAVYCNIVTPPHFSLLRPLIGRENILYQCIV